MSTGWQGGRHGTLNPDRHSQDHKAPIATDDPAKRLRAETNLASSRCVTRSAERQRLGERRRRE